MKIKVSKISAFLSIGVVNLFVFAKTSFAAITNPAIDPSMGNNPSGAESGDIFLTYFVGIWRTIINVGALLLLLYMIWGGIDWITAGGDSGKVGNARNKITQAVIGMIILAFSFVLIGFIGKLFFGNQFDLLDLTFVGP